MLAVIGDLAVYGSFTASVATRFLEAADQWVREICGRQWDQTGTIVQEFFDVREGDILTLSDESPLSVTSVAVYEPGISTARTLSTTEWALGEKGKVHLRRAHWPLQAPWLPPLRGQSVQEALNTLDRGSIRRYDKAVVTFEASGVVPASVREAVALIAAASILQAPKVASGIRSESMGDYSYSTNGTSLAIPDQAIEMLAPHAGKPFVVGKRVVSAGQLIW